MGMYDHIQIHESIDLDNAEIKDRNGQTKSMDCNMDRYRIDENRQLWIQENNHENQTVMKKHLFSGVIEACFNNRVSSNQDSWKLFDYRFEFRNGKLVGVWKGLSV